MKNILSLLIVFTSINFVSATVLPSRIFSNNMVLQRNMPIPVWGTAAPKEEVTVKFLNQKKTTTADSNGKWSLELNPVPTKRQPSIMKISGSNTVEIRNILVGEVWICAGQSNMELGVGAVKELKALVPEAKKLPIRTLYINKHIDLKPQTEVVGGWGTTPPGSAVAFGFSYFLQKELNLPVGVIVACWGSSSIEGWMPLEMTRQLPHFKDIMDKFYADQEQVAICKKIISSFNKNKKFPKKYSNNEQENSALEKKYRNINIFARTRPNLLYNAMMHPLIPYSVKGLVWYQGEANTKSISAMKQYKISLKVWLSKLRELWRNDELDALVVMLPGFGRVLKGNKDLNYPGSYTWATMRESQLAAMQLPHTYVANTVDLGEANNIHPKDKLQVCQRLALLAAARVYEKPTVGNGPIFSSGRADKEKFVITFTNANGLKTLDGEPAKAFWLADRKEHWVPAKAEIKGNQVILTAEGMSKPIACRYAYSAKPEVNLVNSAGLPAYPFRTDSWE